MTDKIYVPKSGAKKIEFKNGGSLLKFSFHVETFQEFLAAQIASGEYVSKSGYLAINLSERRAPSEWGDTHYAALDTWKPSADTAQTPEKDAKPTSEDIPF
jgi:hypothetical protein